MIKTKDLRIGNYVNANHESPESFGIVTQIGDNNSVFVDGGWQTEGSIMEIRINPNILMELGFRKNKENQYILDVPLQQDGKREIIASSSTHGWFCYFWVNGCAASNNKYSVHELQNLYFASCGKDLTFK